MTPIIIVLHTVRPTFMLPLDPDAQLTPVATIAVPDELRNRTAEHWLEHAFRITNSIERPWHTPELAAHNGMTNVTPARSTSVGDAAIILDDAGARAYACDTVGWIAIPSLPATTARSTK
jgi:hypothetical protein